MYGDKPKSAALSVLVMSCFRSPFQMASVAGMWLNRTCRRRASSIFVLLTQPPVVLSVYLHIRPQDPQDTHDTHDTHDTQDPQDPHDTQDPQDPHDTQDPQDP